METGLLTDFTKPYTYSGLGLVVILANIAVFGWAIYLIFSQLLRSIRQAKRDWGEGLAGAEAYHVEMTSEEIRKEAIGNTIGAIAAGVLASFIISSYGWWYGFIYIGPFIAFLGGLFQINLFYVERADDAKAGREA